MSASDIPDSAILFPLDQNRGRTSAQPRRDEQQGSSEARNFIGSRHARIATSSSMRSTRPWSLDRGQLGIDPGRVTKDGLVGTCADRDNLASGSCLEPKSSELPSFRVLSLLALPYLSAAAIERSEKAAEPRRRFLGFETCAASDAVASTHVSNPNLLRASAPFSNLSISISWPYLGAAKRQPWVGLDAGSKVTRGFARPHVRESARARKRRKSLGFVMAAPRPTSC